MTYKTYSSINELLKEYRANQSFLARLGVRFKVEAYLEPSFGKDCLANNNINRDFKLSRVDEYYNDMVAETYGRNPQSIVVCETGELIDGQNRSAALVRYGKPVLLMVEVCTKEEAIEFRKHIDHNLTPRSKSDMIQITALQNGEAKPSKKHVEVLNAIAEIYYGRARTYEESYNLDKIFGTDIKAMFASSGTNKKNRTTAATRAAFIIRLHNATPQQRKKMLDAWSEFCNYDVAKANKVTLPDPVPLLISTLEKYTTGKTGGTTINKDRIVISWQGWDLFGLPKKKLIQNPLNKITKTYAQDLDKFDDIYEELREAIEEAIENNPLSKVA